MRLIDADALPRFGKRGGLVNWCDIVKAQTIDAVPVVRCRDCKFLRFTGTVWKCQNRIVMMLCEPNDFCSRAERKEE